jgi:hypothetical protein
MTAQRTVICTHVPSLNRHSSTRFRILINGTGLVSLSTETLSNNSSENNRMYAAGPMQVSEVVALGGGEYDGW